MCRRPASTPATERKEPRENSQTSVTNGHCCAFHSARRTMGRAAESFLHRHPATVLGRVATRGRCPCRGFRWISGLDFRRRKQRGSTAPRVFLGGNDRQLAEFNPHADEITYRDQPARRQLPLARKKNFFLQGQRDPDFGDMKRAQGHENERFEIQLYAVYRDGGDNGQVGARRLPPGRFFLRSWSAIRWSGRPYRRIPALVKAGTPDSREKCTSLARQQHHDDKIFAMANLLSRRHHLQSRSSGCIFASRRHGNSRPPHLLSSSTYLCQPLLTDCCRIKRRDPESHDSQTPVLFSALILQVFLFNIFHVFSN